MTHEQQAVEDALQWTDALASDNNIDYARTAKALATEVRRLRVECDELRDLNKRLVAETTNARLDLARLENRDVRYSAEEPLTGDRYD